MDTNKQSAYNYLNNWLYDGNNTSKIPKYVLEAREIGPQYLLWYFKNSIFGIYINKHFNNYDVYQLDKETSLKFLKQCIQDTGFRPKFFPKQKSSKSKIYVILKSRYPYFKSDDINLLITIIDKSEEKDQIYETLGLYSAKKKKTTKSEKKSLKELLSEKPIEEETIVEKEIIIEENENESGTLLDRFLEGFYIERS